MKPQASQVNSRWND